MKMLTRALLVLGTLTLLSVNTLAEPVWIDVRSEGEYAQNHIDGDANVPLATIDPEQFAAMYGKDAEINLYCQSGGRAGRAKDLLETAGFTNVTNVGGIDDVRELRDVARSSSAQ